MPESRLSSLTGFRQESAVRSTPKLAARLEPFDSYWQAPDDVDSGYKSLSAYYRANNLPHIPTDRGSKILVISCGPGYLVDLLVNLGYGNVLGIDSDARKVEHARRRGLPCEAQEVFPFLSLHQSAEYDCIIPKQELNHLTIDETISLSGDVPRGTSPGGRIIVYAMNGANPLVGSENLAHNIDHFYNLTEHSITQLLQLGGFQGHTAVCTQALCVLEESVELHRLGRHRLPRDLDAADIHDVRQEGAHRLEEDRRGRDEALTFDSKMTRAAIPLRSLRRSQPKWNDG